ncbi:albino or Glassy Yellow 1 [Actinidia rufa]|uniref:Protein translocase subunit SecA n=1 Tax=Actinidia rufa TaxID=165716 RepID=A0A7J0G0H1_9ERIC|nr:albino or Glassy Yellow 1 [Actinidia rufa]
MAAVATPFDLPANPTRARAGPFGRRFEAAPLRVFAIGNNKTRGLGERLRFTGRGRGSGPKPKASLGGLLGGIFKGTDTGESTRQQYASTVSLINSLEAQMSALSDSQLRDTTSLLQQRARQGDSLLALLPEAFAVVREASKRVLGLRPFDVQLIGGMVLHNGEIAEMRTGEGKTLVAILPAYLNALTGKGVHIVTVNDYLARRDCEWVGQVPRFLGLKSVDELVMRRFNYCVIDEVDSILIDEARTPLIISGPAEKPSDRYYKAAKIAAAFERDVHYTVDEKQKTILLTEQGYADAEEILDVKDLYDPREQWASYVLNAMKAKELFLKDVNYIIRGKEVLIVDEFTGRVMQGRRWSDGLHQAVEAKEGLPIQNETVTLASISYQNFFLQFPKLCGMTGTAATESAEFESIYKLKVTIVPTNKPMIRKEESDVVFKATTGKWRAVVVEISRMYKTGRPVLVGTTSVEQSDALSEMLHEAGIPHEVLNAKPENVEREAEIVAQSGRLGSVTIATNMAGRGTDIILGGNAEFIARLKLREMLMPRLYLVSKMIEYCRVVKPAEGVFVSVKKPPPQKTWKVNEKLFPSTLSKVNTKMAEEAVELAVKTWGQRSLTELEAEERLSYSCEKGPAQDEVIAKLRSSFLEIVKEYKDYTEEERKKVVSAGGLHVVGTERHESRRIDNQKELAINTAIVLVQLRGRSGRQGDPGSSRFFLSLEDNIFRIFGGDRIQGLMRAFRVEDLPIESKMLTKALDEAQRKVENYFFDIRKQLFEYDEVLNSQRDRVYTERRRALESDNLQSLLIEYAELTMDDILEANIGPDAPRESWDFEKLIAKLQHNPKLHWRVPHVGSLHRISWVTITIKHTNPKFSLPTMGNSDSKIKGEVSMFPGDPSLNPSNGRSECHIHHIDHKEIQRIGCPQSQIQAQSSQTKTKVYATRCSMGAIETSPPNLFATMCGIREKENASLKIAILSQVMEVIVLFVLDEVVFLPFFTALFGCPFRPVYSRTMYCYFLNDLTPDVLVSECSNYAELQDYLHLRGREAYLQKRDIVEKQAPGLMKEAEKFLILSNIDRLWKEHLQALKFVQQAVGLRGYAQRDPLIEYKLEGYNLFIEMMAQIRRNVIYSIYQFQPVLVKEQEQAQQREKPGESGTNGRGSDNNNPDPVVAVDSSSTMPIAEPQASS